MAEEARESLGLDEMLLIPAGQPMLKKVSNTTPAKQRLEMLRLAVTGKPYLKIATIELERPGPTYTVDTLIELKKQYGDKAVMYFILGWDSLAQLPEWYQPKKIPEMCYLVAVPRPGFPKPDPEILEKDLPGISEKVIFMDRPRLDISASEIREMAAAGKDVAALVPGPVAAYIRKNKLYV
jgi:nicotinate-nucleotide adenylyltransferase